MSGFPTYENQQHEGDYPYDLSLDGDNSSVENEEIIGEEYLYEQQPTNGNPSTTSQTKNPNIPKTSPITSTPKPAKPKRPTSKRDSNLYDLPETESPFERSHEMTPSLSPNPSSETKSAEENGKYSITR